ncbi:hypothetical protein JCM11641_008420 [Rhodosporidiobolus odoratus]
MEAQSFRRSLLADSRQRSWHVGPPPLLAAQLKAFSASSLALAQGLKGALASAVATPVAPVPFPPQLRTFIAALLARAEDCHQLLITNSQKERRTPHPADLPALPAPAEVLTTEVLAGNAQRRYRPKYSLAKDGGEGGKEDDTCRKFYRSYGQTGLAGGIMGVWCPHGICVGYHTMPSAEGRNDVFSMLYCYWEKAPTGCTVCLSQATVAQLFSPI